MRPAVTRGPTRTDRCRTPLFLPPCCILSWRNGFLRTLPWCVPSRPTQTRTPSRTIVAYVLRSEPAVAARCVKRLGPSANRRRGRSAIEPERPSVVGWYGRGQLDVVATTLGQRRGPRIGRPARFPRHGRFGITVDGQICRVRLSSGRSANTHGKTGPLPGLPPSRRKTLPSVWVFYRSESMASPRGLSRGQLAPVTNAVKELETPKIEASPDSQEFGRCGHRLNSCQE